MDLWDRLLCPLGHNHCLFFASQLREVCPEFESRLWRTKTTPSPSRPPAVQSLLLFLAAFLIPRPRPACNLLCSNSHHNWQYSLRNRFHILRNCLQSSCWVTDAHGPSSQPTARRSTSHSIPSLSTLAGSNRIGIGWTYFGFLAVYT